MWESVLEMLLFSSPFLSSRLGDGVALVSVGRATPLVADLMDSWADPSQPVLFGQSLCIAAQSPVQQSAQSRKRPDSIGSLRVSGTHDNAQYDIGGSPREAQSERMPGHTHAMQLSAPDVFR